MIHVVLLYGFARIGLGQYAARGDGSEYLTMAEALTSGQLVGVHFPLYPALISALSLVMPTDLAALAIPPVFHILFAMILYKIFEDSKHAWLYSLTLALFPPSVLIYNSSALSDSLTIFFTALVFYYGLKGRENRMLVASFFAGSSHYYAILLIVPLTYWLWKKRNVRKLPFALVPLLPLIIFSVAQFFARGDFLYYVRIPEAPTFSWGTALLTYPFGSLVYAATALSGLERLYWSSYIALVYFAYGMGLLIATRRQSYWRAVFSAPFYLFSVVVAGYYFVPRFLLLSFPSLIEFAELEKKLHAFRWILVVVIIANTAYAVWFLLIRVPASGFAS